MKTHRFLLLAGLAAVLAASAPMASAADDASIAAQSFVMDMASPAIPNQETSKGVAGELLMSMHNFERSFDMSVRAKVLCTTKNLTAHQKADGSTVEAASVSFVGVHKPMYGPDGKQIPGNAHEENRIFGEYSPNVQYSMYITNPGAHQQFTPGKLYYVDFSEAPA